MNEKGIVILWFGGRADFQGLVVDHGHNCTSHSHARSETQEEVVTNTITLNDRGDKQGKSKSNTHRLWMEKISVRIATKYDVSLLIIQKVQQIVQKDRL